MNKGVFNGPLFFIIVGGLVLLAYRYLPFDPLLEKIKAGRGDAPITEQAAPPVAGRGPVDSMPAPGETTRSQADVEPPLAASGSKPALPESPADSAAAKTVPPVPAASPPPPAVAVPEARSPPSPVVLAADVSPVKRMAPRVAVPPEVQVPKPAPRQEPVFPVGEPSTVAAAGKRAPIREPVLSNLRIFVQADVHERAGLGDLGADRYSELLKVELTAVAGDYLGREAVQGEDPNMMFRAYLADGREGLEQICMFAQAQRVLLANVEISAAGFSNIDSAYWPEVSYIAINCGDGRVHKTTKKRLEPHRLDTFEFQQQFSRRAQEFIASQGYFLKP